MKALMWRNMTVNLLVWDLLGRGRQGVKNKMWEREKRDVRFSSSPRIESPVVILSSESQPYLAVNFVTETRRLQRS